MGDHKHDFRWQQGVPAPSALPGDVGTGAALLQVQRCAECDEWGRAEWCPDGRSERHGANLSHRHAFSAYDAS